MLSSSIFHPPIFTPNIIKSTMKIITLIALSLLVASSFTRGIEGAIGVSYGTIADNLPPPSQVAHFLLANTIITQVRLYDANPDLIQAFANTSIEVTITIPNEFIPSLTNLDFAHNWVNTSVQPYFPMTKIARILVGNEVLSTGNTLLIANLVQAMQTLHTALVGASLDHWIQVSTPHSLGILSTSSPPSIGKFRQGYDTHILKPLLAFLRATKSPFMINPYPFFGCSKDTLDYALFRPNNGVVDQHTHLVYTNMLDAQLDATYSAMKLLGFTDVDIVIAETGWPSDGGSIGQVGVDVQSATEYNGKLMKHVMSGIGTPLMPHRIFETYIFSLFNENLKPGPASERNFGLFHPDLTPVYNVGILKNTAKSNFSTPPIGRTWPIVAPVQPMPQPKTDKRWCVPKAGAETEVLQRNLDYVCGYLNGLIDCKPIQQGGLCFLPNTVHDHAAYAMNAFFQATGSNDFDCDFAGTGSITGFDPSYGMCKYR